VIGAAPDNVSWVVVSYGRPDYEIANVKFVTLPGVVDYPRLGRLFSRPELLWLNALYLLPLAPLAWACAVRYRVHVVVANGVVSAAIAAPLRLVGKRILLAYHGTLGHSPRSIRQALRVVLSPCELAFVNSTGSAEDLALVYEREQIRIVPLWADNRFFRVPLDRPRSDVLTVLFVGRQDPEKFAQCLRVCGPLAAEGLLKLRAVGAGPLAAQVAGPNLEALGYIADVDRLAGVYATADVVWAPADVTYLSIPGVEALAAGCPVLVSDIPAVEVKAGVGVRVARDLVTEPIGLVVDGVNDEEAIDALRAWAANGISTSSRQACRDFAQRHHSADNLSMVVDAVILSGGGRP
jgi:glycosyltransferase involved in cell wall biosynthesis